MSQRACLKFLPGVISASYWCIGFVPLEKCSRFRIMWVWERTEDQTFVWVATNRQLGVFWMMNYTLAPFDAELKCSHWYIMWPLIKHKLWLVVTNESLVGIKDGFMENDGQESSKWWMSQVFFAMQKCCVFASSCIQHCSENFSHWP